MGARTADAEPARAVAATEGLATIMRAVVRAKEAIFLPDM